MAVVCAAVLLSPVLWRGLCPALSSAWQCVLPSCHALSCCHGLVVCGVSVCLWCSCGGVSSVHSPLVVVEGGAIVDGGACAVVVGGMVMEGRRCYWLPVECWRPPSACWCPPCRLLCGPVEWREWRVVCCPVFGLGLASCIVPLPFTLSVLFVSFPFFFCLVLLCLLWVGRCDGGTVSRFPLLLPTVCVLCHGIVGLGLCLCDRVVSLWNSGDGCVGWKGVWCLLSAHRPCCGVHLGGVWVVMAVCGGSACLVLLCCGLWNGGVCACVFRRLSSSSLSSSSYFVVVFGVVRAQPCEHARYPRTPLLFLSLPAVVLFSSFSLLVFLHAPSFYYWNGGVWSPCVTVLCGHDGDG